MNGIYEKKHLDLVFEFRNKSYGAYIIRQRYEKNILLAFLFAILFLGTGVAIPYITAYLSKVEVPKIKIDNYDEHVLENITPILPQLPVEAQPKTPVQKIETVEMADPRVVEKTPETIPDQGTLQHTTVGTTTQAGNATGAEVVVTGNGTGNITTLPEPAALSAEVMPEFPGGLEEMFKYLNNNTHYTAMARSAGITGKVFITFIVEGDGEITNVKVLKGLPGA